jgi:hypothetical protein
LESLRRSRSGRLPPAPRIGSAHVLVDLEPDQPPPVAAAVAALLEQASSPRAPADPGPWWRAGLADALETSAESTLGP